tara:strand:+ start:217 stop:339 length:123 start_codon:yes stop_codon:yes gene_type:complete
MADLVSSFIRSIWGSDKPKEVKEKPNEKPKEKEFKRYEDE